MHKRQVVMVVEDDCEMNALQCELLEVHGLEGIPAYSGTEAIELAKKHGVDAVLLDVMLPEMDGFETCRQLRSLNGNHLPIVMITALDSEDCRHRGFEAGADAYFAKPFNPDEVISTLRTLMSNTEKTQNSEDEPR